MELIVEIVNKGRLARYFKFDQDRIAIGRGYTNDVIIADPFVCPEHLVVEQRDEGWLALDCSEKNGTVDPFTGDLIESKPIGYGDELLIGKTRLRFLSPDSPIEPTRSLHQLGGTLKTFTNAWGVTLLCFCLFGYVIAQNYLSNAFEFQIEKSLGKNVFVVLIPLFWAGAWALVGRVLHHETRYAAHAAVAVLALLALFVEDHLSQYLGYLVSSAMVTKVVAFGVTGFILAWLLSKNLAYATEVNRRKRLVIANVTSWSIIGIILLANISVKQEYSLQPEYMVSLNPPAFHLFVGESEVAFFEEAESLFK